MTRFVFAFATLIALSAPAAFAEAQRAEFLSSYVYRAEASRVGLSAQVFRNAIKQMNHMFNDVCGDTFCEGEYSNIIPVEFDCVVDRTAGTLNQCVWKFAASEDWLDEQSGTVTRRDRIFRCAIPLTGLVRDAGGFFGQLAERGATAYHVFFDLPIPGGNGAQLYSTLSACFRD